MLGKCWGGEGIIHLLLWKPLERFTKSTEKQIKSNFSLAQQPSFRHDHWIVLSLSLFFSFLLISILFFSFLFLSRSDRFSFLKVYWRAWEASLKLLFIYPMSVITLRRNKTVQNRGERVNCERQAEYVPGYSWPNFLVQSIFVTWFTTDTISKG